MESIDLLRWSRAGILRFAWNPYETAERLALSETLRVKLEKLTASFAQGRESYHRFRVAWRRGAYFFGSAGTGKSAASRAIARSLGWPHLTVPAHEIVDAHFLERALAEAVSASKRVVVLEDIDQVVARMEPHDFFTILDHAMERGDGIFWVATSRHPENTPKTQLVRPGRFDEMMRLETPNRALRAQLLTELLGDPALAADELSELVISTEGLSFSHFEEMRQLGVRLNLQGREAETWAELRAYAVDQVIAGDRLGGLSDATEQVEQRVRNVDPRVLLAALEMTDVFRALMEKTIGDAAEASRRDSLEQGGNA